MKSTVGTLLGSGHLPYGERLRSYGVQGAQVPGEGGVSPDLCHLPVGLLQAVDRGSPAQQVTHAVQVARGGSLV